MRSKIYSGEHGPIISQNLLQLNDIHLSHKGSCEYSHLLVIGRLQLITSAVDECTNLLEKMIVHGSGRCNTFCNLKFKISVLAHGRDLDLFIRSGHFSFSASVLVQEEATIACCPSRRATSSGVLPLSLLMDAFAPWAISSLTPFVKPL